MIALEGSEGSEKAAIALGPWVIESGADVTLYTIFDPDRVHETASHRQTFETTPQGTFSGTPLRVPLQTAHVDEDRSQALERRHRELQQYLEQVSERCFAGRASALVEASTEDPAEAIMDAATTTGADMIALASHGRGGISRALLGSVATEVMRRSHVPVTVVGPNVQVG
jgi:nucleotide-binding universal stress UspA family protein